MKEWSQKTCISFVQRTQEKIYVVFINENNGYRFIYQLDFEYSGMCF